MNQRGRVIPALCFCAAGVQNPRQRQSLRVSVMPFEKIPAEKLSHAVVRQIEGLILQGVLRPGERLPAERELAETMGVSRPSLREALAEMQQSGLLVPRAGSGVFVAEVLGSAFSPALIRLISEHDRAASDYLAFRRDLEGLAAERAARVAGDGDLAVIDQSFRRMEAAHAQNDPERDAALDVDFHMAIVEAGHNVIALHMMRSMQDLLHKGVLYNRAQVFGLTATKDLLLAQHAAINEALQRRDGPGARKMVEAHLDYVAECLTAQRQADEHDQLARRRLHNRND